MRDNTTIVSFDDEPLMLVDTSDNIIGFEEKLNAHKGRGKLHRAFSIFLFNDMGEVLLQRRSELKPLWPGYWSNTCCSHPRRGETLEQATRRRLREELNLSAKLTFLFKFEYQAQFKNVGSEHELCSVFIGHVNGRPEPSYNASEIQDCQWLESDEVSAWLDSEIIGTTPWFAMEWARLRADFESALKLSA